MTSVSNYNKKNGVTQSKDKSKIKDYIYMRPLKRRRQCATAKCGVRALRSAPPRWGRMEMELEREEAPGAGGEPRLLG